MAENSKFIWVEFYSEFATKLLPYENNHAGLVDKIKRVYEKAGIPLPKLEKDGKVYDIDPFTTFGLFNKGITNENRVKIITSFAEEFAVDSEIPTEFDGIPVLNNQKATFYWFEDARETDDINTLWSVFTAGLEYADKKTETSRIKLVQSYDAALKQKGVKWNITMGLFWARPYTYINLDSRNRWFMSNPDFTSEELVAVLPKLTTVPNGEEYLTLCDDYIKLISSGNYAYKTFPELSVEAWKVSKEDDEKEKSEATETDPGEETENPQEKKKKSSPAKYTLDEQLEIGRRIYYSEITRYEAAAEYGIGENTARSYMRLYRDTNHLPPKQSSYNKRVKEATPESEKSQTGSPYSKEDFLSEVYMTEKRYDRLINVLCRKKNIILQGAPGVGKTFAAKRIAYSMMGVKDDTHIAFVQFHQNYTYEDFVMGYKPTETGFELKKGVFYNFCKEAKEHSGEDYFFIIDEINRGNLSKIFGELLMLIENDYRGTEAALAYNGELFTVPENLYIIGMMNTADRSLALIDYALRRRFSFFDIEPGFDADGFVAYRESLANSKFDTLIDSVKLLNKEIIADKSLGKGFCFGHSYFCNQDECTDEWLISVVEYDLLPTLAEYWFDDPGKVSRWDGILHEALK